MQWSVPIGVVKGTVIRVHLTFLLFLVWIGVSHYAQGGADAALQGVVFILLLFGCVLLHEFGHVFAARRYGIQTPDITLLPIGGVAQLERVPEKPSEELVVALAGPAVNVVIALALVLALRGLPSMDTGTQVQNPSVGLLGRLAWAEGSCGGLGPLPGSLSSHHGITAWPLPTTNALCKEMANLHTFAVTGPSSFSPLGMQATTRPSRLLR